MPDTRTALSRLLDRHTPCPTCDAGALKTERDHQDGHCDICRLTKHGPSGYDYQLVQHSAFRSETEAYDEGIYDDD